MRDPRLIGIIDFPDSILVAPDVLGCSVQVAVSGVTGRLNVPRPPVSVSGNSPHRMKLLAPRGGRSDWIWDGKPKQWGQVVDTKTGNATINAAIINFGPLGENGGSRAQAIYDGFGIWHKRLFEFVKLLSRQGTIRPFDGGDSPGRIEMLRDDHDRSEHITIKSHTVLTIYMPDMNTALCARDFRRAARWAGCDRPIALEYILLLEAYCARKSGDYRSAVLQTGTAVEVALVGAIRRKCKRSHIEFGDALIAKYNALGGKFALAKLLAINLQATDYESQIVRLRNL